jgi:hypothetical protein
MPKPNPQPRVRRNLEATSGALLGASVVAVLAMLSVSNLDRALSVSLYCFGITIPLLAYFLEALVLGSLAGISEVPTFHIGILLIAVLLFIVGLNAVFWHFSKNAGIMFMFLTVVGYFVLIFRPIRMKTR